MLTKRLQARLLGLLASLALIPFSRAADEPALQVDEKEHRVTVAGRAAKQNVYEQLKGAIEYIAVMPGGKEYESLFILPVDPQALHNALKRIGVRSGEPAHMDGQSLVAPTGGKMRLFIEWNDGKEKQRKPVEYFITDVKENKPMAPIDWFFTASREVKDPASGKTVLQAVMTKNLISTHQTDPTVLVQNPLKETENRYRTNMAVFPKEGTPLSLIFEAVVPAKQAGAQRVHFEVSGKVQGVGFREFTQRTAKQNSIIGWARNLANGNVEVVAEGKESAIQEFQEKLKKGPRGAQVESVKPLKVDDAEILEDFEIRETK